MASLQRHWIILPLLAAVVMGVALGYGVAIGRHEPKRAAASAPVKQATSPPPAARTEPPSKQSPRPTSASPPRPSVAPDPPPIAEPKRADPPPTAPPEQLAALPPPASSGGPQAWVRHAVPAEPAGRPMIAIVLDDLGVNQAGTRRAIDLPGPLTLSFMTYAAELPRLTAAARAAGHELMLHVPMEPSAGRIDPGPKVLTVGLSETELLERLRWGLGRFEGYVGINNHMGSRFTADAAGMTVVLRELKSRGLLFLDSMTNAASAGPRIAGALELPHAVRDVFLDHEQTRDFVRNALATSEQRARAKGFAIAIGHPHDETLDVLAAWLPGLRERGLALVPVSAIVRRHQVAPPAVAAGRARTG